MQNQDSIHDEGTYRLWHDEIEDSPTGSTSPCSCHKQPPRKVACIRPGCGKKFKPKCHSILFCCWDCYSQSDLQTPWQRLVARYGGDFKKLRRYMNKVRYRQTEKGRNTRTREYEKTYEKRKSAPPPVKKPSHERIRGRRCKRPGCLNTFQQPPQTKIKRFCSRDCRKTFRDVKERLKAAYKVTRCPRIRLVLEFLQL